MKAAQVRIGATYLAKVSNKVVKVRITGDNTYGGWNAVNLETGREVRIRGAQRLRSEVAPPAPEGRTNDVSAWRGLEVRVKTGELARMGPFQLVGRKPAVHDGEPEYRYEIRLPDARTWTVWESDCEVTGGMRPPSRREELHMAGTTTKAPRKSTAKKTTAKAPAKKSTAKKTAAKPKASSNGRGPRVTGAEREARDERIIAMHKQGATLASIGEDVGMSGMGVYNVLKRHGVKKGK